jgi:hypothetical protein
VAKEEDIRKYYWIKDEETGEYIGQGAWGWVPGGIEDYGRGPIGAFAGVKGPIPDGKYMVLTAKFYDTWGQSHPIRTYLFEVFTEPAKTHYRPISQAEADYGASSPGGDKLVTIDASS